MATLRVRDSVRRFFQNLRGDVKGGIRRRNASVDGDLQQDLLEIAGFELVRETGADVQAEFFPAAERGRGGQHQQSARAVVQARAASRSLPTGRS